MRKLMLISIGFAVACIIGVYLLSGFWLLALALACVGGMIALFFLKPRKCKIAAVILLGCAIGFIWNWGYDRAYLSHARDYDGEMIQSQIQITDHSVETQYGVSAEGRLTLAGKNYRVMGYFITDQTLKPGDRVTGSFRLRYTADGGEKEPTYHQGKGILLLAYADEEIQLTKTGKIPARFFAAHFRQKILTHINNLFPADTVGFARALLLGDSSLLSYKEDTAFQVSGIRHVIAVSGLHVSILFSVIYLFGGKNKVLGVLLGLPLLFAFAAIAGFTPSIIRACVMQALMVLSILLNKEYDPPTALGFSVLLMLVINPLTITSVSFQLSVGCMIGIFLFAERIRKGLLEKTFLGRAKKKTILSGVCHWIAGTVAITVSAMIATTPLTAYYFETISLVGVVTNLLTLWLISIIFYAIMAACVLGAIWLPLGQGVGWLISWAIRYVLKVSDLLSRLPMAAVYTENVYIVVWLIFSYLLLCAFLLSKKKHPGVFVSCVGVVLSVAIMISYLEPRLDRFRFTALDVGQGQCLLIQSNGRNYMIDCGGDYPEKAADEAAKTLLSQGIRRLDGLVLTHYDADHAAGAELLLTRISADTLYLPITSDGAGMAKFAENYKDKIQWIGTAAQFTDADIVISMYPAAVQTTGNESSMCVLCQVENCDILITGDRNAPGERELVQTQDLPKLDVLVVGHHGSKTAASLELLQATKPDIAVISVSANNSYGHPAQDVLDRLQLFGCYILRTDRMGHVIIKG